MKIRFEPSLISDGPMQVLHDLYYYTVHYGVSVRQYTGEHWNYWEELPSRLRLAQDDKNAMGVLIRELEELTAKSRERQNKRRDKKKRWDELEVVINAQFISILAALPARLLANIFNNLIGQKDVVSPCQVVKRHLESEKDGEDTDFVEPDLLLKSNDSLLMVEIKTRGGKTSSRSYPKKQFLNYMRLIAECQNSQDKQLPSKFSHLILVTTEEIVWLEEHKEWVKEKQGHRLYVQPEKCIEGGNAYIKEHSKHIRQILLDTPVYYCSWKNVAESYDKAVLELNDAPNTAHWKRVGDELRILANRASKYV